MDRDKVLTVIQNEIEGLVSIAGTHTEGLKIATATMRTNLNETHRFDERLTRFEKGRTLYTKGKEVFFLLGCTAGWSALVAHLVWLFREFL